MLRLHDLWLEARRLRADYAHATRFLSGRKTQDAIVGCLLPILIIILGSKERMVVIVDHSREAGPAGAAAVTAKEECMMGTTCRMGGRAGIPRGHTAGTTEWEMSIMA
jgi:hypothetical protein